jgi:hypothetical protein
MKEPRKMNAQQLKARLQAKLGKLKADALKRILITCGLSVAVAVAIVALCKLIPVGITLLALLGLATLWQLWLKIRWLLP